MSWLALQMKHNKAQYEKPAKRIFQLIYKYTSMQSPINFRNTDLFLKKS